MGNSGPGKFERAEELISLYEQALPFCSKTAKSLDNELHCYTPDKELTAEQLSRAFQSLSIAPSPELDKLLEFFKLNSKDGREVYSLTGLSTLGILIGKGTIERKAELLFGNYDEDSSNAIDHVELRELLRNLLNISLRFIPKFALSLLPEGEKSALIEYNFILHTVADSLVGYFAGYFMSLDVDELSLDNLIGSLIDEEVQMLTSAQNLRIFAFKKYQNISHSVKIITKYIEDEEAFKEHENTCDYIRMISNAHRNCPEPPL